ncbi:hypothetical protein D0O17_22310 [Salmonella enterica]|nr:hypothetical protein [Salmonella enterica]
MTTITKERIELFVKSPLENGLTRGEQMELARIVLASLDAKTVRYLNKFSGTCVTLEQQPNAADDVAVYIPLYAAPPVPVVPVVPEEIPKGLAGQIVSLLAHNIGDKFLAQKIWNACRAAMLQGEFRDLSQPVDPQISEYEKIMLQSGNSPVIPDGYALVPVEPTDEMIAAAMNCEDVLFNSDESFCVQFGNIYEAMLAAAPEKETWPCTK